MGQSVIRVLVASSVIIAMSVLGFSQTTLPSAGPTKSLLPGLPTPTRVSSLEANSVEILPDAPGDRAEPSVAVGPADHQGGLVSRNLRRGLEDQKQLYLAPLKPKNLKWDALFLGATGGLLAVDRQASRQTGDRHADETGELTLETLANTFLIYTPMQFIAGRERPDDGTGNGRFWVHRNFNTSFPAGHPMFTWAMASVVAHEYPRTWVKLAMYGAAASVTVTRFTGRNHFMSDLWVGSALGYLIGTHIFHARCDPDLSEACHPRER